MTGNQSIVMTMAFVLGLAFARPAWADSASDVCTALVDARSALYSMVNAKDKPTQDGLRARMQAASAKLDIMLAGMIGSEAKVAANFKEVWDQFKSTRDTEIIPAIEQDRRSDAKKIADGIQLDRLSKMWSIMSCK
jgi:hypothetical protein